MLIVTFKDDETEVMDTIVSILNADRQIGKVQIKEKQIKSAVEYQGLHLDSVQRVVHKEQREIKLTFTEFEILNLLAQNPGMIFSKEQIYDIVWKESYSGDYNIVMSHIRNIRKKIEDDFHNPIYIQTVWGVGYRFNKNLSSSL